MAIRQINRLIEHLRQAVLVRDGAGLSDAQLLECFIARHEEAAFEAIVRRHGPMVLSVCRRVLRNSHDAEDSFQATFLVLARKASTIRAKDSVANWLYGVAYQTALKASAAAAKRRTRERQVNEMPEPEAQRPEVSPDWQPVLDRELSSLPEKYRVPIVLCDLEGKSRKDAAEQLGLPEGTLSSRLARARVMLAKRLARHGVAFSGGAIATILSQNVASACVPASLVGITVKAAASIAAGKAVGSAIVSAKVAALTEGVLKAMLLTKFKTATALLLIVTFVALTNAILAWNQTGDEGSDRADKPAVKAEKPEAKQPAKPKQDDSDIDRLQGSWVLVSEERDGIPQPAPQQKKVYTFAGENLGLTIEGGDLREPITSKAGFRLSPTKKPKEIDGRDDGKPLVKGIYVLDGDTLKVCLPLPGKDRPVEFVARQGTNNTLIILQRIAKPNEAKADTDLQEGVQAGKKQQQLIKPRDILVLRVTGVDQPEVKKRMEAERIVGPDGTISVDIYGSFYVSKMTTEQAGAAIEKHWRGWNLMENIKVRVVVKGQVTDKEVWRAVEDLEVARDKLREANKIAEGLRKPFLEARARLETAKNKGQPVKPKLEKGVLVRLNAAGRKLGVEMRLETHEPDHEILGQGFIGIHTRVYEDFTVVQNATILQDNIKTKLADLKMGSHVALQFDANGQNVVRVTADGGTAQVRFVSANEVRHTIVALAGQKDERKVYHLVKETEMVAENGKAVRASEIKEGTTVVLTRSVEDPNTVIRIEISPGKAKEE